MWELLGITYYKTNGGELKEHAEIVAVFSTKADAKTYVKNSMEGFTVYRTNWKEESLLKGFHYYDIKLRNDVPVNPTID